MLELAGGTWEEEFHATFRKLGLPEDIISRTVRFSCEYTTRGRSLSGGGFGSGRDTFDGIVIGFRLCLKGHLLLFVIRTNGTEKMETLTYGLEPYYHETWCMEGFRWSEGRGTTDDPESTVNCFSGSLEVLPD